ncbi:MAG: protoporphyrinogen oxidase [Desulfobulbus propionicus]|nr:MAG: protoporphyrinogen oxidase [Desulfobulbus propionicus]
MENQTYDVAIIGAGLSGLATAAFILDQSPDKRILLLEKSHRVGGAIQSYQERGYMAEWGPHGFLDHCEESNRLVQLAGLEKTKKLAPLGEFVRYVCLDGELKCIPQTLPKIIREPLIPFLHKLRFAAEWTRPPLTGNPTVAQWVEHRFGKAILPFADAVFTGTYAGDIHRLNIDAVMPGVRDLELNQGSVLKGAFSMMRQKRKKGGKKKGLPAMTSFTGGMQELPQALAAVLREKAALQTGVEVTAIAKTPHGWQVSTQEHTFASTELVVALPVNQCLPLMKTLPIPQPQRYQIPEARIVSVLLGFGPQADIPFGFGYLTPEQENRFALGALFSSHMFPKRAPEGYQLLEILVGGRRHPERLELADQELINGSYTDLRELIHLPTPPVFSAVLRSPHGIPQLEEGYTELLKWRKQCMLSDPTLHICGFGWKGIGLNDMTKEAKKMAQRVITHQANVSEKSAVKKVYF